MDALREAVVFLLGEYVEVTGTRYMSYIDHIGDLEDGDTLLPVLREKRDKLEGNLAEAKTYLEILKTEKA